MRFLFGMKKINPANLGYLLRKYKFSLMIVAIFLLLLSVTAYITQLVLEEKATRRHIKSKHAEVLLVSNIISNELSSNFTETNCRLLFDDYMSKNNIISMHICLTLDHTDKEKHLKIVNPSFSLVEQNYFPDLSAKDTLNENLEIFSVTERIVNKWKEHLGYVTVVYSTKEIHKKINPIKQDVYIIFSILFVLLLIISLLIYNSLITPLVNILQFMRKIEAGDFSLRIPAKIDKFSKHEFGLLISIFNNVVDKLESYEAELHSAAENMEQNVAEKIAHLTKQIDEKTEIEMQLKTLNQTITSIMSAFPLPIIALSADFEVVDASGNIVNMFGYEPNEIIGRELLLIYNKDYNILKNNLRENINKTEATRTSVRGRHKNGKIIELSVTSVSMFHEAEESYGFLLILDDVTDYLETERKSRENEIKFRTLIDESISGIIMLRDEHIIFANAAAAEILEYPNLTELYKTPIDEIIVSEYRYQFYKLYESFSDQNIRPEIEVTCYYGNRKTLIIGTRNVEIENEKYLQVTFSDITGEKEAKLELIRINETLEERIVERTKQLNKTLLDLREEVERRTEMAMALQSKSEILDSAASICIVYNENGEVTYTTPYTLNTLKRKKEELLGSKIWEIPHRLDTVGDDTVTNTNSSTKIKINNNNNSISNSTSNNSIAENNSHGKISRDALIAMAKREIPLDDKSYILEVQIPNEGVRYLQLKRSLGVNNTLIESGLDITDQILFKQKLEKALVIEKELGELKTRFVSMVSHEYRTPLTVISSSASVIRQAIENSRPEMAEKFINRIEKSVETMTELMENVLTLGKSASKEITEFQEINLPDFTSNIVTNIFAAYNYNTKVNVETSGEIPIIYSNETALEHILQNLVTNAMKYTINEQDAKVIISVAPDERIRIDVADKGIGIPEQDIKNLFTDFYRANNVGNISGTGLGLSIVKQNVEALGGDLTVSSQVGVGTTFTVLLPINSRAAKSANN